jgi:hypothetical protein
VHKKKIDTLEKVRARLQRPREKSSRGDSVAALVASLQEPIQMARAVATWQEIADDLAGKANIYKAATVRVAHSRAQRKGKRADPATELVKHPSPGFGADSADTPSKKSIAALFSVMVDDMKGAT